MPFDKSKLPAPPEFPASNASYNKIVGKMHKAALGATTATAAIAAVHSITAHVTGTNTYAKATRRYGDKLVEFIGTDVADAATIGKAPAKKAADMTPEQVVALIGDEAGPKLKAKAEKPAIPLADKTPEPKAKKAAAKKPAKASKPAAHVKLPLKNPKAKKPAATVVA